MEINKLLLKNINTIIKDSTQFDEYFKILNDSNNLNNLNNLNNSNNIVDDTNINLIQTFVQLYANIRSSHGFIIILHNKMINNMNISELNNQSNNELYDISTFYSILSNINNLVNNIDIEFKKIAMKYPKFINTKFLIVLLFLDISTEQTNKYEQLIANLKSKYSNNIYKIIKLDPNKKKFKCNELLKIDLTLKIKELPIMYIINSDNVVEVPLNIFNSEQALMKIFE